MSDDEDGENRRIVEINLKNQNLTILDQGIFQRYANANRLLLSNNQISQIDDNVFDNIRNLTSLYLEKNRLLKIDRAIRQQTNLKVLNLKSNRIREIEADTFERLDSLRILRLSNNNLARVSPQCLLPLVHLTTLQLSNTNIGRLAPPFFNANIHLTHLYLDNCNLEIEPYLFRSLRKLKKLDLSDNGLTELDANVFRGLRRLEFLKITNNLLSELPAGLIADCGRLDSIDLSDNNLASLSDDFFAHNPELNSIELYACNSRLRCAEQIFRECPLVDFLSCGACERIPIGSLTALKKLYVKPSETDDGHPATISNNLHKLLNDAPNTMDLVQIQKCHLKKQHFDAIIDRLRHIDTLLFEQIVIDNSNGPCLRERMFEPLLRLNQLSIRKTPLSHFDYNLFGRHNMLRTLALSGCELRTLNARYFRYLNDLTSLDLSDNFLVATLSSDVFIHLPNLRELLLNNCEITQLPNRLFEQNRQLEGVYFEDNPMFRFNYDSVFTSTTGYPNFELIAVWELTEIDGAMPGNVIVQRKPLTHR